MKALKIVLIALVLTSTFSSCIVVAPRHHGYYHRYHARPGYYR